MNSDAISRAPVRGSLTPVATAAAASALDNATFLNGTSIFVQSFLDEFVLSTTSTATPDGINTLATYTGVGRWLRRNIAHPDWQAVTAWKIQSTGSDENDGSSAHPLLTLAEFFRRTAYNAGVIPTVGVTVTIADSPATTDTINGTFATSSTGFLLFVCTATTVASGTFTSVAAINRNTPASLQLTDSALAGGWTPLVGLRWRITASATPSHVGCVGWVTADLQGSLATVTARTTPARLLVTTNAILAGTSLDITPSVGDSYVVETLPTVHFGTCRFVNQGDVYSGTVNYVTFASMNCTGVSTGLANSRASALAVDGAWVSFSGCQLISLVIRGSGNTNHVAAFCCSLAGNVLAYGGFVLWRYCLVTGGSNGSETGAQLVIDGDTVVQSDAIVVDSSSTVRFGCVAFWDWTAQAISVLGGGCARSESDTLRGVTALYGNTATASLVAIVIKSGGQFLYASASTHLTGTASDVQVGGDQVTWAQLSNGYVNTTNGAIAALEA